MAVFIGAILLGLLLGAMCLAGAWVIQDGINQAYDWKEEYKKRKGGEEDEEL